jgi:cytochrome c
MWIVLKTCLAALAIAIAFGNTSFAAGDAANGERIFKKSCFACHGTKAGERKAGPTLHGIVGRKSGTVEGFKYSKANSESNLVWTDPVLDEYLINPRAKIPGTIMAFVGLKDAQERADLIAYLNALK